MLLADNTDNVCIAANAAGKDTGGQIEAPLALQTVDTDILGIVEELEDTADILGIAVEELADTAVKLACNADILGIAVDELADTADILDTGIADTVEELACNADILDTVEELVDTEDSHEEYQE